MNLTNEQLPTLKAAILTAAETEQTVIDALAIGNLSGVADWYNEDSAFVVWKTFLEEHEVTSATSAENTTWNWTTYINTSVAEKMAWERIFNGTFSINPSLLNTRLGIADIFSGPQGADQRAHLLAVSKRFATRAEEVFATGAGTTPSPGDLVFEGYIGHRDILKALALP